MEIVIERIGSCNDCGFCTEKQQLLPVRKLNMNCGYKFYIKSCTTQPQLDINVEILDIKFAELIPAGEIPTEFTVEIQGSCSACGFCCGYRDGSLLPEACSHLSKKGKCLIYQSLYKWCEEHQETHEGCIPAPNQPVREFNPACGYSFIVITPGSVITGQEILYFEASNFTGHLTEGTEIRK